MYADTCLFINVVKHEFGFWPVALKVLLAAERGDIQLVASTLLLVELSGWRGDIDELDQDELIQRYLRQDFVQWAELDLYGSSDVLALARKYHLRGADAAHLQTAVRLRADYFMSHDRQFPYGQTVEGVAVMKPDIVWDMTTDDAEIDTRAEIEEEQEAQEAQRGIDEAAAQDALEQAHQAEQEAALADQEVESLKMESGTSSAAGPSATTG